MKQPDAMSVPSDDRGIDLTEVELIQSLARLGPDARKRVVRSARPRPMGGAASKSDEWCSPPEITDRLVEFFDGPVDVDPCSNRRSLVQARRAYYSGGLFLPWRLSAAKRPKGTWYQNDPYSASDVWTDKMLAELACGNVREGIRLAMFACSTRWWALQCTVPKRNPRILALKRIAFLDPYAKKAGQRQQGCRFEPALIYFGPNVRRFGRVFAKLTRWSTWGRS